MKTKMLLLAMAILGTSLVYSQNTDLETKTDCEKKVLKKIKRKMALVNFRDYVELGQKTSIILTCFVNENKTVEVADIEGIDEKFNTAIIENLKKHPVKCETQPAGQEFTFVLTFKHIPY